MLATVSALAAVRRRTRWDTAALDVVTVLAAVRAICRACAAALVTEIDSDG
jgi:hypothetical protein